MSARHLVLGVLFLIGSGFASATSVRPPTFEELVRRADLVVRGQVTALRTVERTVPDGTIPVTVVTVTVERELVGDAPATLDLEFLGGTIGGRSLLVTGQPRFVVGDRDVLFVEGNGRQLCPLVNMMYGRYRLQEEGQRIVILRSNGEPLLRPADVSRPLHVPASRIHLQSASATHTAALTASGFEDHIRSIARTLGRQDVQP